LGASTEIFTQADQSLSAVGTEVAEGTAGLDDGDFITFAEGVDTINNFATLDLIGTAGGTLATDSSGEFDVDAEDFGIADDGYAIIAGTMDAETGVFTADADGTDTLFAYDSDAGMATLDIEFVVLVGVDAGTTDLGDIVVGL